MNIANIGKTVKENAICLSTDGVFKVVRSAADLRNRAAGNAGVLHFHISMKKEYFISIKKRISDEIR